MWLSREFSDQLKENENVVHEVCRAQMTYLDYKDIGAVNLHNESQLQ